MSKGRRRSRPITRFSAQATINVSGLGIASWTGIPRLRSMRSKLRFSAAFILMAAWFVSAPAADFASRYQAVAATKGHAPEATRLHELFKVDWAITLETSPELATYLGVPGYDMKWTDLSPAAIAGRRELPGLALRTLAMIDRAQLSPADQLNFDLFKRQAEEAQEGNRF